MLLTTVAVLLAQRKLVLAWRCCCSRCRPDFSQLCHYIRIRGCFTKRSVSNHHHHHRRSRLSRLRMKKKGDRSPQVVDRSAIFPSWPRFFGCTVSVYPSISLFSLSFSLLYSVSLLPLSRSCSVIVVTFRLTRQKRVLFSAFSVSLARSEKKKTVL